MSPATADDGRAAPSCRDFNRWHFWHKLMTNFPDAATQFGVLATFYDELMDVVPYDAWVEYVMLLFSVVRHQPRRILDCACGTGNVTFKLAEQGLTATGVDLSLPMIRVAQAKAQARKPPLPVRFFQADLSDFSLGETFDSATCLYDSLNYILDPAALQAAFDCIAQHVEPDGIFVFDMNSVHALTADLFTQRNRDPRRALHYDWQAHFDPATRICTVQMEFERTNRDESIERFHEVHRERAYALSEVEAMLQATGWQLLQTYDAYTLNRPHQGSERWFFVAQRV
ncbi:MAG: class I SAM-dependent methyltransferase [Armatimonadota bacterium]|nr:class I SAM-dependent methyltransferase [Armatimonadota bacterium]